MTLSLDGLWQGLEAVCLKMPFLAALEKTFPKAELFLVGGAVRDLLLGRKTKDYDFLVRGLSADALAGFLRRYGKLSWVGKSFGVYKFYPSNGAFEEAIDFALPRTESSFSRDGGYRDFKVVSDAELPVEKDLARRDFTINAIAVDLRKKCLIDPFKGLSDLQEGLLRAVGDPVRRFEEDSSRLLRGLRFAAQFAFDLEPESWRALKARIPALKAERPDGSLVVPRETVAKEFIKAMVFGPLRAFDLWDESGAFAALIPELLSMKGCPQPTKYHSEGDVWAHTRLALSQIQTAPFRAEFGESKDAELVLAVLFHDIAKPSTIQSPQKDGVDRIRFNGHDRVGAAMVQKIVPRLKLSSFPKGSPFYVDEGRLAWLVKKHLVLVQGEIDKMRAATIERIFLNPQHPGEKLLQLIYCDGMATVPEDNVAGKVLHYFEIKKRIEGIRSLSDARAKLPPPLLNGHQIISGLRIPSGPQVGKALALIREEQLSGRILTPESALSFLKEHLKK